MHHSARTTKSRALGEFRFSIIGGLLASPPSAGELKQEVKRLAARTWTDPLSREPKTYSESSIERWFYTARNSRDPVGALSNTSRSDKGKSVAITEPLAEAISLQYQQHKDWTWMLHFSNIKALARKDHGLGKCPSYTTFRRYMKTNGMLRQRRVKRDSPGRMLARDRLESREIRSFEMEFVTALWHLDFHHGSRRVLGATGEWVTPICLAIHDDHSRLCCHIQWFSRETCESLVHGLIQAFLKRGLPRSLMTDNGSAMKADEFVSGLSRLGIIHDPCLPYSPYQNGKTERFWGTLESQLMPMIPEGKDLTLEELNTFTLSWVEMGYNREKHREIGMAPTEKAATGHDVGRASPDYDELRKAFRARVTRRQRRSDGTVTIDGTRYEVPMRWRHQESLVLHYARWEPSLVHLLDAQTDKILERVFPCDKLQNADGMRRPLTKPTASEEILSTEPAPLLRQYLEEFAMTGLPLPYLPQNEDESENL